MISSFHKKLIAYSSGVRKYLAPEIMMTAASIKESIDQVMTDSQNESEQFSKEISDKIKQLLGKKFDRKILLKGFPKNWDVYLKEKSSFLSASFRHREFLDSKMDEIILALKNGEKFDIENNVGMAKLFGMLKEKYGITFTFIHGFGYVLSFENDINQEDINPFPEESFHKALCITNTDSGEIFDTKTRLFQEFIIQVVNKKLDAQFTMIEFLSFCKERGEDFDENDIRGIIRKVALRGEQVGIIIKNGISGQIRYTIDFKPLIFLNYLKKYFPTQTGEFEQGFDTLFSSYRNRDFIELLKKEILSKNQQTLFFKTRDFIDIHGEDLYNRVVLSLKAAKEAGLVDIKGKDSYYIVSKVEKSEYNYEHILGKFSIKGELSKLHINILNNILSELAHIINMDDLKENDISIEIQREIKVITITIYNSKLKGFATHFQYLCDEFGEKYGYTIISKT